MCVSRGLTSCAAYYRFESRARLCSAFPWLSCHRNAEEKSARICCENAAASGIPVRTGSPQLLLNSPGDFSGLANTHGACAWNYRNRGKLYGKARSISRTGAQFCPWASIETCPPLLNTISQKWSINMRVRIAPRRACKSSQLSMIGQFRPEYVGQQGPCEAAMRG